MPLLSTSFQLINERGDDVYKERYGQKLMSTIHHIKTVKPPRNILSYRIRITCEGADGGNLDDEWYEFGMSETPLTLSEMNRKPHRT